MMELEICADSVESAIAAEQGGAQRIELCGGLIEGGVTPSLGLIRAVRSRISIGIHVMIRPRGGDFLYSEDEMAVMREDIAQAAKAGAQGIVLGLLTADGDVDVQRTRELIDLARPMNVTFHRAIDVSRDLERSIEDVITAGADRVLSSGGKPTAVQGSSRLHTLVKVADGRLKLMAGGGVRADNVVGLAQETGAVEFHASLRTTVPSPVRYQVRDVHMGDPAVDDYARSVVLSADVRTLRNAMNEAG